MNSVEFSKKLSESIYNIEFTKADGTLRKMRATRMGAYVPSDKAPKGEAKQIEENQRSVPVFDLDILEWRSVTVANIISMELVS